MFQVCRATTVLLVVSIYPVSAKPSYLNPHQLEAASSYGDPQLQMGEI